MKVLKKTKLSNGFVWVPVHYSHDPEKSLAWAEEAKKAYPKPTDWDRELEIDFGLHVGSPAYPRYDDAKHLAKDVPYNERKPLHLGLDFNTNPMSLVVDQVEEELKLIRVLKTWAYGPTTIDDIINEFRNRYNAHRSDVIIYGDATKGTNAQTAQSNWDIVRLAFRGYHIVPVFRVPFGNPRIGDRLNAVNRMLQGEGPYTVQIDVDENEELVRDFREVILTPDGKKIHKVNDQDDPYYFRTHTSDAWGYRVHREYPTVSEVVGTLAKKRDPIVSGQLMGEIDFGPKWREQRQRTITKRKPLDRRWQR